MKLSGIEPNDETYVLLMQGHANKGQVDEIEKILNLHSNDLHMAGYFKIAETLILNGYFDEAMKILSRGLLSTKQYYPDYLPFLANLVINNKCEEAVKIIHELKSREVFNSMQELATGVLLQMLRNDHPLNEILKLCIEFSDNGTSKFHTENLYKNLVLNNRCDEALEVLKKISHHNLGEIRSNYLVPILIKYNEQQNNEGIENVAEFIRELKLDLDFNSINLLVSSLLNSSTSPLEIARFLIGLNINKNHITNFLANHLLAKNDLKELFEVMYSLRTKINERFVQRIVISGVVSKDVTSSVLILNGMLKNRDDSKITLYIFFIQLRTLIPLV